MQSTMPFASQQTPVTAPVKTLPLPPGWIKDSGYFVFRGTPIEWDEVTGRPVRNSHHPRYRSYRDLATLPDPCVVPDMPVVYYLRFSPDYVGVQQVPDKKTQTATGYCGCTTDLWRRVCEHLEKTPEGSPLVAAALDAGIEVTLSGVWLCETFEAAKQLEAIFKSLHNNRLICPEYVPDSKRALIILSDPAVNALAGAAAAGR